VHFFGFWVLELPMAWWLAVPAHVGSEGVFLSIVIAECSIAAAGMVLFRRGRWARQQI
jgi:Na+-driven multidrug efflux pump